MDIHTLSAKLWPPSMNVFGDFRKREYLILNDTLFDKFKNLMYYLNDFLLRHNAVEENFIISNTLMHKPYFLFFEDEKNTAFVFLYPIFCPKPFVFI